MLTWRDLHPDSGEGPDPHGSPLARERSERRDGRAAGKSVLVVDDESDARDTIVELLESEGYTAIGLRNGAEALSLLRSNFRPSAVLLDLRMPVLNGWDFCDAVAADERLADIPIAIVTASASVDRLPVRRRDAGLFIKPVNFARLLKTLEQICEGERHQ